MAAFLLTMRPAAGDTSAAPAKSGAGFGSPVAKAHSRASSRFFCAQRMAGLLWLAVREARKGLPVLSPVYQPARSASLFGSGVAGINQLRRLP